MALTRSNPFIRIDLGPLALAQEILHLSTGVLPTAIVDALQRTLTRLKAGLDGFHLLGLAIGNSVEEAWMCRVEAVPRSSLSFESFLRWAYQLEALLSWNHASEHRIFSEFISISYDSISRDFLGERVYTLGDNTSYQVGDREEGRQR